MSRATAIRRTRAVNIAILGLEAGIFFYDLSVGHLLTSVIPAFFFLIVALIIRWQTRRIRAVEVTAPPRPDYWLIAQMEREIYGEPFRHERGKNSE